MKILSTEQIREADAYTIANEPITSIDLMERASNSFVEWFSNKFSKTNKVHIFCGPGNNGGDGFAIGRLLHQKAYSIQCYLINFSNSLSEDCSINKTKMDQIQSVCILESIGEISLNKDDIIIDAIFGSGINKEISGIYKTVIEFLNQQNNTKVAIDIPSGLHGNEYFDSTRFKADYTLCFEIPKLSLLIPENGKYVGEWITKSIQLHPQYLKDAITHYHYVDEYFIKKAIYKKKGLFDHKGNNGHALIIGGSKGKIGAPILSTKACLKAGAGLVSAFIPSFGHNALINHCPEAMSHLDTEDYIHNFYLDPNQFSAIGIGPGLDQRPETKNEFVEILKNYENGLVIDADAINLLAEDPVLIRFLPKNSILTPHPGEFKRLVGNWKNDYDRLELQKEYSKKWKCYIILKGRHTSISTPEGHVFFNSAGNPGMATAGSGDTLTGIITALLAQGYNSLEASILGTYIHGKAGDMALKTESYESLTASDIINNLGKAFKSLNNE